MRMKEIEKYVGKRVSLFSRENYRLAEGILAVEDGKIKIYASHNMGNGSYLSYGDEIETKDIAHIEE